MAKARKTLEKILSGSKNIRFEEFVVLVLALGFVLERTRGSHHVFSHPKLKRPFPVQPHQGKAKDYQVKQLLELIEQFELEFESDTDEGEQDNE